MAWSLLANASDKWSDNAMNVAFPNQGTEYWGTAFRKPTTFTISGKFPDEAKTGVRYAGLTVYDAEGMVMGDSEAERVGSSINYAMDAYSGGRHFEKTFRCTSACLVLYRVYRPLSML